MTFVLVIILTTLLVVLDIKFGSGALYGGPG